MSGLDLANARLATPPREPLARLTRPVLVDLAERLERRGWDLVADWFWGEAVLLQGILRVAAAREVEPPPLVLGWLEERRRAGVAIEHVNHVAPAAAALMVAPSDPVWRSLADDLEHWLSGAVTRAPNGAIEHWPGGVWADTVYMAGLFLARLGVETGRPELLAECGRQLLAHAEVLQDPGTGLYAHGSHDGVTIPCRWGRANAWCALASVEFLELASASGLAERGQVEAVRDILGRQLRALTGLQPEHGVWSVLVDDQPETRGILETSAAAGIGAAMLRASAVVPDLDAAVTEAGWRAVRGALAYVDPDGALTRASAGTVLQLVPFGYSVIRDDLPQLWGQGLALQAVASALEHLR